MSEIYSGPTAAKDLFKGVLTVILLGVCALSILLLLVIFLISLDGSEEGREQAEWCAEYMPEASRSECAAEAGW
tara:strand:- start:259 stop:480 length:222 start_codon:yes stop_codon:yes gene_type:complete